VKKLVVLVNLVLVLVVTLLLGLTGTSLADTGIPDATGTVKEADYSASAIDTITMYTVGTEGP